MDDDDDLLREYTILQPPKSTSVTATGRASADAAPGRRGTVPEGRSHAPPQSGSRRPPRQSTGLPSSASDVDDFMHRVLELSRKQAEVDEARRQGAQQRRPDGGAGDAIPSSHVDPGGAHGPADPYHGLSEDEVLQRVIAESKRTATTRRASGPAAVATASSATTARTPTRGTTATAHQSPGQSPYGGLSEEDMLARVMAESEAAHKAHLRALEIEETEQLMRAIAVSEMTGPYADVHKSDSSRRDEWWRRHEESTAAAAAAAAAAAPPSPLLPVGAAAPTSRDNDPESLLMDTTRRLRAGTAGRRATAAAASAGGKAASRTNLKDVDALARRKSERKAALAAKRAHAKELKAAKAAQAVAAEAKVRAKAESAEAHAHARAEAKAKAEADATAEAEARARAEAKAKAEAEAQAAAKSRAQAEAEAAAAAEVARRAREDAAEHEGVTSGTSTGGQREEPQFGLSRPLRFAEPATKLQPRRVAVSRKTAAKSAPNVFVRRQSLELPPPLSGSASDPFGTMRHFGGGVPAEGGATAGAYPRSTAQQIQGTVGDRVTTLSRGSSDYEAASRQPRHASLLAGARIAHSSLVCSGGESVGLLAGARAKQGGVDCAGQDATALSAAHHDDTVTAPNVQPTARLAFDALTRNQLASAKVSTARPDPISKAIVADEVRRVVADARAENRSYSQKHTAAAELSKGLGFGMPAGPPLVATATSARRRSMVRRER